MFKTNNSQRWLLAHRVTLHNALKTAATKSDGKGKPVKLHLSSKVVDVDPHTATVTLESGEKHEGDLIIGADGVHSVSRKKVPGGDVKPFSSGKNAFRFLISRESALKDPVTKELAEKHGSVDIWFKDDRRVVCYPTSDNTLLNFVAIHPDEETTAGDGWQQSATKESIAKVYKDFEPRVQALLDKADPETTKVWQLLDMEVIPTFVEDKLALIGDAAHPFLPHQGQGGAQAIEDAAALAALLPYGTHPHEVSERLKWYQEARHERATKIQEFTRLAGADRKADVKHADSKRIQEQKANNTDISITVTQFMAYNFGHDAYDSAKQLLRKNTWAKTPDMYWRQPVVFGPMPGPRQDFTGKNRVKPSLQSTFTTASVKIKTSRTLLENLLPNSNYSFISPGTVAYCSFSQTTLGKMDWLGKCGGYSHLGLYIHGIQYKKSNGEVLKGTYMPILFESLTDPIVSGREELGMPKLYSAIDIAKVGKSYNLTIGWQGETWGRFNWTNLEDQDPNTDKGVIGGEADAGILVHRYIPAVGREHKGVAEAEYPVFVPHAEDSKIIPSKVHRVRTTKDVSFEMDGLDWWRLPTLHHIVGRLAEIPVYEVVGAKVVEGEGVPDVSSARRVE